MNTNENTQESLRFQPEHVQISTSLVTEKVNLMFRRVDGGVSNNNFIVQLMADLTNQPIDRSKQTDNMTSLGTAFLAGLAMGKT